MKNYDRREVYLSVDDNMFIFSSKGKSCSNDDICINLGGELSKTDRMGAFIWASLEEKYIKIDFPKQSKIEVFIKKSIWQED